MLTLFKFSKVLPKNIKTYSKFYTLNAVKETLTSTKNNNWKKVREDLLNIKGVNGINLDGLVLNFFINNNDSKRGLSYLQHLNEEKIELNLATLGKYMKLLRIAFECKTDKTCSEDVKNLILKLYGEIKSKYATLDTITLENVIQAITLTPEWEISIELLQKMKLVGTPNGATYSAVISAAFINGNDTTAWSLMQEAVENERNLTNDVFITYLRTVETTDRIERLFNFCEEFGLKFDEKVTTEISKTINEKLNGTSKLVTIGGSGICPICKYNLRILKFNDKELLELRNEVMDKVLVGRDPFLKTNSEELEKFYKFLNKNTKYDVVIDGLNVAHSTANKNPRALCDNIKRVISHFAAQGSKKILVLGRTHMSNWPRWSEITKLSDVFLTLNLSQDDPYLLLSALNSGNNVVIVSRDLMRGHYFLLKDYKKKLMFRMWLEQRRWHLLKFDGNRAVFQMPNFALIAQKFDNTWHIPVAKLNDGNNYENDWLCIHCK